jgi:hypothetical protein
MAIKARMWYVVCRSWYVGNDPQRLSPSPQSQVPHEGQ